MCLVVGWLVTAGVGYASQPLQTILVGGSAAFKPFLVDRAEMERAMRWGQDLGERGASLPDVQAPWRFMIDKDGEFGIVVTAAERAAELGFVAGQQLLPEDLVQERLDALVSKVSDNPLLILAVLRSLPHKSRAFGSAGRTRPGTPANVYEAQFLLDAGFRKFPAISADEDFEGQDGVRTNRFGLRYRDENRPDVQTSYESPSFFENARMGGSFGSYGATYVLRWSFVDEKGHPAFGPSPSSLGFTVLTPDRKREFTIDLTKLVFQQREGTGVRDKQAADEPSQKKKTTTRRDRR